MVLQIVSLVVGMVGAAVVVGVVFRWWSEGAVSGTEFFVLSTIYGGLVFGLFASVGHPVPMLIALTVLLASVGWMLHRNQHEGIRKYYRDKVSTYEQAIIADPANFAAREAMANAYYQLGDLDRAIGAMEMVEKTERLSVQDRHRLKVWREERDLRDCRTVVCPNCHARNFWGVVQCRVCDCPIAYRTRGWWATVFDSRTKVRLAAAVAVWIVVAIGSFAFFTKIEAGAVVGCFTLSAVGWLLLSSKY